MTYSKRGSPIYDRVKAKTAVDEKGCWIFTGHTCKQGYGKIMTRENGVKRPMLAHRAMWEAINGKTDLCVCHICDNPSCVNPAHLFLGTRGENNRDRNVKGRSARGAKYPNAILNEMQVAKIKRLLDAGRKGVELAEMFGVQPGVIYQIKSGRRWKHVQMERAVRDESVGELVSNAIADMIEEHSLDPIAVSGLLMFIASMGLRCAGSSRKTQEECWQDVLARVYGKEGDAQIKAAVREYAN